MEPELLGRLFGRSSTVIRAGFDIKRFTEPYQYFWDSATNHALAYFQGFTLEPGAVTASPAPPGVFTPGSLNLPASADDQHLDAALAGAGYSYFLTPPVYAASLPESQFTWTRPFWGVSGFDSHIQQPNVQEWNLGIQKQLGSSNVLEVRYVGHRSVHQWIVTDPDEVNIIENGFLKEFQNAQSNLNICLATPSCASSPSFGDQGIAGQVPLPIFDTAFKSESGGPGTFTDYHNATFRTDLLRGAVGALATSLAYPFGRAPYICNLVGSSLSPCTTAQFEGFTTPGAYPLNFFQANPYGDGTAPGSALANIGYMGCGRVRHLSRIASRLPPEAVARQCSLT